MGLWGWTVFLAYLAILLALGFLVARRPRTEREYFRGSGAMPLWAVATSVVVTATSSASFIGAPQQSYDGDLTYLIASIGGVLGVIIVALCFIPAFYRHQVTTVYDLIEARFGSRARRATSAVFLAGRLLGIGVRLYMAGIGLAGLFWAVGGSGDLSHIVWTIIGLTLVGALFSLSGGIVSIIWTDVLQFVVLILAIGAVITVLLVRLPWHPQVTISALASVRSGSGSKLDILRIHGGWSEPFTLWTALTGWTVFNIAAYGTDQDLAQRLLTCRNARAGSRSALVAVLLGTAVTGLFMLIGLLLYVVYQRPDLAGSAALPPPGNRSVFAAYALHQVPAAVAGLVAAGLFSTAFSPLLSALNAMASSVVNDWYRPWRPQREEAHYLRVSRWAVLVIAVALAVVAGICAVRQPSSRESLITFALNIMNYAYSGLVAVFLTALLGRRGNGTSVLAALLTGVLVTWALDPGPYSMLRLWTGSFLPLGAPASPWQLLIASAMALVVCLAGRPGQPQPSPLDEACPRGPTAP